MADETKTAVPRKHRIAKAHFLRVVKEHTRPGRPAFAALARELGLTLVEDRKCALDSCNKAFLPVADTQTHCSPKCANVSRQRRFYQTHVKKA
jgi:hypothetical protein